MTDLFEVYRRLGAEPFCKSTYGGCDATWWLRCSPRPDCGWFLREAVMGKGFAFEISAYAQKALRRNKTNEKKTDVSRTRCVDDD